MRLFITFTALTLLTACSGTQPTNLGVNNGALAPCPDSPNCVSSFASRGEHFVNPLNANLDDIRTVLTTLSEAEIVGTQENYLHVEFTSKFFRFVDDVEFLFDAGNAVTHVRSASRVGHSDLGVNRERVERIRSLLSEN